MRVGVKSSTVVFRRLDSVARQAATVVREATSGGDPNAVGHFLGSFGGYLTASSSDSTVPRPASASDPRRPPRNGSR
jgi:hypothetical protein